MCDERNLIMGLDLLDSAMCAPITGRLRKSGSKTQTFDLSNQAKVNAKQQRRRLVR